MKRIYVADRETGNFIEEVYSLEEGKELISRYEMADRNDGIYEENFYSIADEDHCEMQYEIFYVGGKKDGEILEVFADLPEAKEFAYEYTEEHTDEFDPVWGGVAISDGTETIEW